MKNYVIYRGELIAKTSYAYELWESHQWGALNAHLERLKRVEEARIASL